jgi:hypothetical protein
VIYQLYFSGGSTSFASEFKHHFLTSKDHNGVIIHKVPVPLVALVATAVRCHVHRPSVSTHYCRSMPHSMSGILVNDAQLNFPQIPSLIHIKDILTHSSTS